MAPRLLRISYVASVRTHHYKMIPPSRVLILMPRLHILCFFYPVSTVLVYTSSLLASTSLLTAMLLIHRHEGLEVAQATEAVRYFSFRLQNQFFILSLARISQWSPFWPLQIPRRCSRLLPASSTLTRWLTCLFLPMVGPHLGKIPPDLCHSVDPPRHRILHLFTTDNHNLRGYRIAHFEKSKCQVGQYLQG